MRVSIVVPCRDAAPYLAQTLGSALEQTRPPHEIVVVDDGSTDGSLAIARRFEARHSGLIGVLSERSGSAARTRNLGALAATGDALMFLDADDVIAPATLEALGAVLSQAPSGLAICPWFRLVHDAGLWVARPASCVPRRAGQDPLSAWLTGWYHPPCAVLWSRAAFERAGRWDERATTNDDGDLVMRALVLGVPLLETSQGAGFYRRRADGATSLSATRATPDALCDRIRIVEKISCWLEERGRLGPYRDAVCEALHRIAADAGDGQPRIRDRAYDVARRHAPPLWTKVARRVGGARHGGPGHRPTPPVQSKVTCGLASAARIAQDNPPPIARPLRRLERPAVSVIIPTYNRAALLRRALGSVLAQTNTDFEVLVVDDGSTDGTSAVVAACRDPRIRCLRQPRNAGVAAARNRGLREARADLLAFLDSDDEWRPDKLARQVALFKTLPDRVGLIYTGVENVYGDGRSAIVPARERGDVYRRMLARNVLHGAPSSAMIRRAVVATAGFFDETLPAIEDYDYWLRVTRWFEVECIDEPLTRYHDTDTEARRSRALRANLDARRGLYRRHAREMRRARTAHLFLLRDVRRALEGAPPDVRAARRLAVRAVIEAPASRMALGTLMRALVRPAHDPRINRQSTGSGR